MNERRQRAMRALGVGLLALGSLTALSVGCQATNSLAGAQTAIALAQTALPAVQTALPGVQTALPGLQTALPGLQATAQAGATLVGALSGPQAIAAQLQLLLAGASVNVQTTPEGAANSDITQVTITATDTQGTFGQLDASTRTGAATGALLLMAQYFPNAAISLSVVDRAGAPVLSGTKAVGQQPTIQ